MLSLFAPIESLPKTHKPHIAALKKLGILTVQGLLLHFPRRYLDFSKLEKIKNIQAGQNVTIKGTIKSIGSRFSFRGRMSLAEAVVSDETGSIKVVWFNQPYLAGALRKGDEIFLAGQPDLYNFSLQLTNPIYEKMSDFPVHTARLVPVYPLTQGLYPKTFRNFVASVIGLAKEMRDILPAELLKRQNLLDIEKTILFSHFPKKLEEVEEAKKRLAFEEIFLNQLAAQKHKLELAQKQSYPIKFNQALVKNFVDSLPFKLTAGQKKAAWEILQDLEKPAPMNRLLEGDVGSGKTVVALIAALQTANSGFQTVFLAPTEILAGQHYKTLKKTVTLTNGRFLVRHGLLTSHFSVLDGTEISKIKLQKLIAAGMPGIFIGTHALLAKKVKFKKLGLVVIDEQHRFGVEQRSQLLQSDGKVPHLLSLTATPIPRTLQLAVYGDLDVSQIKQKPADRKAIVTKLVDTQNRAKAYEFVAKQIALGRQAFVITPRIEQNEALEVKSAKQEAENLKKIFPQFNISLLHGRMKSKEKEKVMSNFLENRVQILVSTSVVEVGVDVQNASVMLIEGAQAFGLAQLHQFRGRVGRAEHQSYCFLFSDDANPETRKRLFEFTKTQDGFALAELDLKQRGFGEMYGSQQSGWNFKYFNPNYTSLIPAARQEALNLLKQGLSLSGYPQLKEKIASKTVHFE